jgi:lambda family phage minor tail protein L
MLPVSITDLDLDAKISLLEISEFNFLAPTETIYLCNFSGVSFESQEYQAIGIELSGFDLIGQGQIPNPNVTISNVGRIISNWMYRCKVTPNYRLEGCTVTRRTTQKKFLDGQPNSQDAIREFTPDIFQLEQVSEETYAAVKFKLATPFDIENTTLPSRLALRSCSSIYRGSECGYQGPGYTINNQPTLDATLDVCPKSLEGCEARFGKFGVLPFGGFPGLGNFG